MVGDDGVRYSKLAYDGHPDEISCLLFRDFGEWFNLNPLVEIIYCYDGKFYPFLFGGHRSNKINLHFAKGHGKTQS